MFNEHMTKQDTQVYEQYQRIVKILTTDEYSDMYSKIGAITAKIREINEIMEE